MTYIIKCKQRSTCSLCFAVLHCNENTVSHWMDGHPAPQAILDLLACNCTRKCELPNVNVWQMDTNVLIMCRLSDCQNQALHTSEEDIDKQDYEEELEDDYEY